MSQYNRKDRFYQKAKQEGYPARSAYKLIELDRQFRIFKKGAKIVDLGCAPGGWLMVCEERLKPALPHCLVGIDLLPLKYQPSPGTLFIQGDFLDPQTQQKVLEASGAGLDWVLSDMSPNLSGIKFKDTGASVELCEAALEFARKTLKKGGGLIVKVFPGPDLEPFKKKMKAAFERLATVVPEATRKTSDEIYLVGNFFKG